MSLADLARRYGTDKLEHGYCPLYERHVVPPVTTLLEIGIGHGGGQRMFKHWLFPAQVMGIDIDSACVRDVAGTQHLGDATLEESYERWLPATVDVIVDDGSHQAVDVVAAFDLLWPRVSPFGWYVIEDLACVRQAVFGGDETGGQVMEMLKAIALAAVRDFCELHVYKEIAFIQKITF